MSAQDELAIRSLVARYCDAVSRRDEAAWAATWDEDCTWDLGRGRVTQGRQETVELWTRSLQRYPWVAQLAPTGLVHLDDADPDRATGSWWVLELNHLVEGGGALHLGHYDDEYRRTVEGWRFRRRRFAMVYRGPLPEGTVSLDALGGAWT